jgi:hypothetical protein
MAHELCNVALNKAVLALAFALESQALNSYLSAYQLEAKGGGRHALNGLYRLAGALARELDAWQTELVLDGQLEVPAVDTAGSLVASFASALALVGAEIERLCRDVARAEKAGPS